MRRYTHTFLILLLLLTSFAVAAGECVELLEGQHHSDLELHPDDSHHEDKPHQSCHHCGHAHAHFYSLQRPGSDDPLALSHHWAMTDNDRPATSGDAPPTPPPKARV